MNAHAVSSSELDGLFSLVKEARPEFTPRTRLTSIEMRMVLDKRVTTTAFGEYVMQHERRGFGSIERDIEWLAEQFGIPARTMFYKPKHLDDDVLGFSGFTTTDAVGLLIAMEDLGLCVAPALLVEALLPDVTSKALLTDSEYRILTYKAATGRRKTTLRSNVERDSSMITEEEFRDSAGYRYKMTRQNGQALSLEVKGPKHREIQHEYVTCDYCDLSYETNNTSDSRRHRAAHRLAQQLLDPKPRPKLAARLAQGSRSDIVDSDAPMWMQEEVRKRARKFKREFKYDSTQWPDNGKEPIDPGWEGYLLTAGPDGTIAGACAFFKINGEMEGVQLEWSLQWVWLAPKYRRQGILLKHWPLLVERYGNFFIEPPVSDAMRGFVAVYGTDVQKGWFAKAFRTTAQGVALPE